MRLNLWLIMVCTPMLLALAIIFAALAYAAPEDPYNGEDYAAAAINPITGRAMFGAAGTQEHAIEIAMTMCQTEGPCVVAQTAHHGCVGIAFDPVSRWWAGGQGPDLLAAATDASFKLPEPTSDLAWASGHCST